LFLEKSVRILTYSVLAYVADCGRNNNRIRYVRNAALYVRKPNLLKNEQILLPAVQIYNFISPTRHDLYDSPNITLLHYVNIIIINRRREMYSGHARPSVGVYVCLSAAVCPYYWTDSDVTWGNGRDAL